jgi:hypothetical protein
MFPDSDFTDTIKPMSRDMFQQLVLVQEVTIALIMRRERCQRLEAMSIFNLSCRWGAAWQPISTGTAGEDIAIEYENMLQQWEISREQQGKWGNKGKLMPREQTKREEDLDVQLVADYSIEYTANGQMVIVINDDHDE